MHLRMKDRKRRKRIEIKKKMSQPVNTCNVNGLPMMVKLPWNEKTDAHDK